MTRELWGRAAQTCLTLTYPDVIGYDIRPGGARVGIEQSFRAMVTDPLMRGHASTEALFWARRQLSADFDRNHLGGPDWPDEVPDRAIRLERMLDAQYPSDPPALGRTDYAQRQFAEVMVPLTQWLGARYGGDDLDGPIAGRSAETLSFHIKVAFEGARTAHLAYAGAPHLHGEDDGRMLLVYGEDFAQLADRLIEARFEDRLKDGDLAFRALSEIRAHLWLHCARDYGVAELADQAMRAFRSLQNQPAVMACVAASLKTGR